MYHWTIRPLYAYVSRRVGGNVSLAEDLVQETWMRALDDWTGKGIPREPLARLRRSHSEVLEAFYFEGKTVHEIAADYSLSERAVEGRLRRARAGLKKKLDRMRRKPADSRRRIMEVEDAKPTRTR